MPFQLPENRQTLVDRVKTDVQQYVGDSSPFLPRSWLGGLCTAVGGRSFDWSFAIKELIDQSFPQTATGIYLDYLASFVGITKNQPTVSTGTVAAFGIIGSLIPAGSQLTSNSGNIYITQDSKTITTINLSIISLSRIGTVVTAVTNAENFLATGQNITISGVNQTDYNGTFQITFSNSNTFTYQIASAPTSPATGTIVATYNGALLTVISQNTGEVQNLSNGERLSQLGLTGVESIVLVTETSVGGGSDLETEASYRNRIIYRYQNPVAEFNYSQLKVITDSIAGVTRSWVFPTTPHVGYVSIYFTRDNDSSSILPSPSEILTVRNAILAVKPSNMEDFQVIVNSPEPVDVDFVFASITPNTPEMKSAITSTLNFLFRDTSINVSQNVLQIVYECAIITTEDSLGNKLNSFTLNSPVGDIIVGDGQLAVLNSITFLT